MMHALDRFHLRHAVIATLVAALLAIVVTLLAMRGLSNVASNASPAAGTGIVSAQSAPPLLPVRPPLTARPAPSPLKWQPWPPPFAATGLRRA